MTEVNLELATYLEMKPFLNLVKVMFTVHKSDAKFIEPQFNELDVNFKRDTNIICDIDEVAFSFIKTDSIRVTL